MAGRHARPTRAQSRAGAHAVARQERSAGPRRRHRVRRRATIVAFNLLGGAAAVLAASMLSVVGSTGTFALWNGSKSLGAGSVTSGTVGLTITGAPATTTNLLPGEKAPVQELSITNTGDVALEVSGKLPSASADYSIYVMMTTTSTSCGTDLTGVASLKLGAATAADLGPIAKGATMKLCTQIKAESTVTPTESVTLQPVLTGTQIQ